MPGFNPSIKMVAYAPAPAASASATGKSDTGFSLHTAFHDLLDIVNPLQHLPIVGTLYRAITGDTIGTMEKIAGDTLYGGVWGAVSSVADAAFEAVTGKDFGATMLALVTGDDKTPAAKAAAPVRTASVAPKQADGADVAALTDALSAKGVNSDLSTRALYAYRRSQGLTQDALSASLN